MSGVEGLGEARDGESFTVVPFVDGGRREEVEAFVDSEPGDSTDGVDALDAFEVLRNRT